MNLIYEYRVERGLGEKLENGYFFTLEFRSILQNFLQVPGGYGSNGKVMDSAKKLLDHRKVMDFTVRVMDF